MINSNSISSTIQNPFHHPLNSHKTSLTPSDQAYYNFPNTNHTNRILSIKPSPSLIPKSATINEFHTKSLTHETLYELLGISENVTLLEIKRAYKQMALKYHPDVSPVELADEYTMKFIMVQEAYETLSDPKSRAMYDSCMAKGLHVAFLGSRFDAGFQEKTRWKQLWEVQLAELERKKMDQDRRMTWAAQIREQRSETCAYEGPNE
ncbi:chaperone protein dnaJ 20, chloroplastic-like [Rutidosis leptorrhynchoides]|uniref:chaperone protein dnaJ 20, chloroplastic-like n=1 Tax=Rutidosis leptorrhynchoides TaxID=125765 RepID=UPI003A994F08